MGFEQAGWECVYSVEWDKHKRRAYNVIFGSEPDGRDIMECRAIDFPRADCWTFGAPCQDFSLAGYRSGLDGDRSSLVREVFRLVRETKEEYRPKWLLYENVRGMLSSNKGFDYLQILTEMESLGYDIEWQMLNSKDFGVPQNRERVFTIGHKRGTKQNNIFPIERVDINNGTEIEKVYLLSERISSDVCLLSSTFSETEEQELPRGEMQELLKRIQQEIKTGESREIQDERSQICNIPQGSLQEIKDLNAWTSSNNNTGGVCGVVQIPTEGMLLLWTSRGEFTESKGRLQQQDIPIINRQNGFNERIRSWQSSTLLLAVQSYQGRYFYSIGDGGNWSKIYSKEVGRCNNLASVLEDEVDAKYFLSEELQQRLTLR